MALHPIDWAIFAVFMLITVGVALYFRSRGSRDLQSYFLGGRNLPWWLAGVSMVATSFAADTPLAVSELVLTKGISGNWLWWNMLAGGMLTTFFFARLWRRAGVMTEAELVEVRYAGRPAQILRGVKAVYLGFFMNILIMGWVNLALASLLEVFFGLNGPTLFAVLGAAMLFAAGYSSISGLWGVAATDALQFAVAMGGSIILAIFTVNAPEIGGIQKLVSAVPNWSLQLFPTLGEGNTGSTFALGFGAFLAYVGVQWWASWYPGGEPGGGGYVAQRMMSTKTERGAVFATLLFQIAHYCIRPWPWILVALCCFLLYPNLPEGQERMGYLFAIRDYLPAGLKGLLLTAFFAAYLSTISTQLNWGASYLVNDLYLRFFKPQTTVRSQVSASRWATLLLMVVALGVTTQIQSVSGVWAFLIECGAGLGLVLILRWYWWRINVWSEIAATLAPFVFYAVARLVGWEFPDSYFFTVGATTLTWLAVTYLTPPTDEATLKKFYQRVQPGGIWPANFERAAQPVSAWILLVCWLSSIVFVYSTLFIIGKIIFSEWKPVFTYAVINLTSLAILLISLRKTRILN